MLRHNRQRPLGVNTPNFIVITYYLHSMLSWNCSYQQGMLPLTYKAFYIYMSDKKKMPPCYRVLLLVEFYPSLLSQFISICFVTHYQHKALSNVVVARLVDSW